MHANAHAHHSTCAHGTTSGQKATNEALHALDVVVVVVIVFWMQKWQWGGEMGGAVMGRGKLCPSLNYRGRAFMGESMERGRGGAGMGRGRYGEGQVMPFPKL